MASYLLKYIQESKKIDNGPPVRYQLMLNRVNLDKERDRESKLSRFTLGERDPRCPNKTVLLVGATGSGKSTLINTLVNFVMGVEIKDNVWFEIITVEKDRHQLESQTSAVSVYDIFGFEGKKVPYSLSIIDTPGFGDTRGIEHDDIVTKKLQDLFSVPEGVDTIDAVGLVLKASENRLEERMTYIFNSVTSLFACDMEKNIVAMITHSTGGKPKALQALEAAQIRCVRDKNELVHFKFNNRQTERNENDSDDETDAVNAFAASNKGMKKFTEFLTNTTSQSLKSTVEVMRERIRLTACIQNAKERVATIELKQEAIKNNRAELAKLGMLTRENQNIMITVQEAYKGKEDLSGWWDYKAVTCKKCEENCHYPGCTWAWGPSKCQVMKEGKCTSCSGKCPVEEHVKEKWRYVNKTRPITKPASELMNLEKEKSNLEEEKKQLLNEAFQLIEQLEKIALNANSISTYQHLEFLTKKMEEEGDKEKVRKLNEIKDRMDKDEKNKAGANYYMRYFKH